MLFYLGTHQTEWMERTAVPLFISYIRLSQRRTPRRIPGARWALDSGGFSQLDKLGTWTIEPTKYVDDLYRFLDIIGQPPDFVAIQDWMCEPFILEKTGLDIYEHQRRTIDSWFILNHLAPDIPWLPVLQGWHLDDYFHHAEMYEDAGADLFGPVGLGSVCRRQGMKEAAEIVRALADVGYWLHGFGFKTQGLLAVADSLVSADSMAWSFVARRENIRLPGHKHLKCNNCLEWALIWRRQLLAKLQATGVYLDEVVDTA